MASSRCVAIFSLIPWNALFQRPQQVVSNWPEGKLVVFVEPLVMQPGNAIWPKRLPNGWRLSVPMLPHGARNPGLRAAIGFIGGFMPLRRLAEAITRAWLRVVWLLAGLPRPDGIIVESPQYQPILRLFPEARVLVDYMDDLLEFRGIPPYFREDLRQLLYRADAVVATSEPLQTKLQALAPIQATVIGNGVDTAHFNRERWAGQVPDRLKSLPGRRIVYAGSIGYWVDLEWMDALSREFPNDTLCIFGPVYEDVRKRFDLLAARPNVYYGGVIPYPDLPKWLVGCDVGIIPFLENELTLAVNPNKAYEYAAIGLPFVSRWLPPLIEFLNLVPLVRREVDFLAGVRELFAEAGQPAREDRLHRLAEVASRHSWKGVTNQMAELLGGPSRPD